MRGPGDPAGSVYWKHGVSHRSSTRQLRLREHWEERRYEKQCCIVYYKPMRM
jgi:hypothetical protein